jgi:hypothetical protein
MKPLSLFHVFWIAAIVLVGCNPLDKTVKTHAVVLPVSTQMQSPSPTAFSSTSTKISSLITSATPTPVDTLTPEQALKTIRASLQETTDCTAPCFWNIVPGQTTSGEAKHIFSYLGLQTTTITYEGKDFISTHYQSADGLSEEVILTIQRDVVENLRIEIQPKKQKASIPREWSAYSPETLIERYGMPSRVIFSVDWGPNTFFVMEMYYDELNLIVQYSGNGLLPGGKGSSHICPSSMPFDDVRLWMGKDPVHSPPGTGIPLE